MQIKTSNILIALITVSDGNHARFDYTLNGITQSGNLVRQVFAAPGTVCH